MATDPQSFASSLLRRSGSDFIDLRQVGSTGLKQHSGFISENVIRELEGRRAVEIYKEMAQTDSVCAVIVFAIEKLLKSVKWHVTPASSAPFDVEAADFLESCMHDMEDSWADWLSSQFIGTLTYGHALCETVYKRRAGDAVQDHLRSKFSDGRIGWRGHMGRAQDTIYRWLFDANGKLTGAEQQAPPHYRTVTLPMDKCLLFRTSAEKNNPEGASIFRSSYRGWFIKRGIENIEAVGVEKDISGLPIVWVPRELLAMSQQRIINDDGSQNYEVQTAKKMVEKFKQMATEVRQDAHMGLVMPLEFDDQNNKRFDITLLQSAGPARFNCSEIIQRYDQRIAMSTMSDFLLLGQGATATGSWAMHADKTRLWLQSIEALLQTFCEILNNQAVPRLMRLNTLEMSDHPRIEFGSLEQINLGEQGDFLVKCAQSGMQLWPDETLEAHFRRMADWPEKVTDLGDTTDITPQPVDTTDDREVMTGEADVTAMIGQEQPSAGNIITNVKQPLVPVTNTEGTAPYV